MKQRKWLQFCWVFGAAWRFQLDTALRAAFNWNKGIAI